MAPSLPLDAFSSLGDMAANDTASAVPLNVSAAMSTQYARSNATAPGADDHRSP